MRRYGVWMREQAQARIGHLYPKMLITEAIVAERPDLAPYQGDELTVIARLWARTVKSPSPAFAHVEVPLASTFILSSKAGKEAYVEPVVQGIATTLPLRSVHHLNRLKAAPPRASGRLYLPDVWLAYRLQIYSQ